MHTKPDSTLVILHKGKRNPRPPTLRKFGSAPDSAGSCNTHASLAAATMEDEARMPRRPRAEVSLGPVDFSPRHPRRRHDDRADSSVIATRLLLVIAIGGAIVAGIVSGLNG